MKLPLVLGSIVDFGLVGMQLTSYTSSKHTGFSGEGLTSYQTSLTVMALAVPSLPSLPPLAPTPKLATPLTSLLPTASTAPIGYADSSQHVSEIKYPILRTG